MTIALPSRPRKRRSTLPLFPEGSVANWTSGTAGCSSPLNWTSAGSEMTSGPLGEMLGWGRSAKPATPASRAAGERDRDRPPGELEAQRADPLQVGRDPEAEQAADPEDDEDAELVVPGEDRRQVDQGEAHPDAGVEVAAGRQVEAGDRDQDHDQVGLGEVGPEEAGHRVEDEVGDRQEHHPGDQRLEGAWPLEMPPGSTEAVAGEGDREGCHRHHRGLPVPADRQRRDAECEQGEAAGPARILDRRSGQQAEPHSGETPPQSASGHVNPASREGQVQLALPDQPGPGRGTLLLELLQGLDRRAARPVGEGDRVHHAGRLACLLGQLGPAGQPLQDPPDRACLPGRQRLQAGRPEMDPAAAAKAVPGLRRRQPRQLVGRRRGCRIPVEQERQHLQAGRLELPHHQLAAAGARLPVDPAQRIAGAVLADAVQVRAVARPDDGQLGLDLPDLEPVAERGEERQGDRQPSAALVPARAEEPRADRPTRPPAGTRRAVPGRPVRAGGEPSSRRAARARSPPRGRPRQHRPRPAPDRAPSPRRRRGEARTGGCPPRTRAPAGARRGTPARGSRTPATASDGATSSRRIPPDRPRAFQRA